MNFFEFLNAFLVEFHFHFPSIWYISKLFSIGVYDVFRLPLLFKFDIEKRKRKRNTHI